MMMWWTFYLLDLERPTVDKEKSLAWLCSSGLKGEMESLTIAARDQALNTHCYCQRNIMKQWTTVNAECPVRKNTQTYCCGMHSICAI
jgi:hypothetical protein